MKSIRWEIYLGFSFLLLSIVVYAAKTILLGEESIQDTIRDLFNGFGFLFINVFMTSLVLNHLLTLRDKKEKKEKADIIRSTFFSEVGTPFLRIAASADPHRQMLCEIFSSNKPWDQICAEFTASLDTEINLDISCIDLESLASYLHSKRDFSLRLLENPVFLEQSDFTELLRALFHLTDELDNRSSLCDLPVSDVAHLAGDIARAYDQMQKAWILHMDYLYKSHPCLFSLALRTNPFDPDADSVVK
jgi:hypothetical protein